MPLSEDAYEKASIYNPETQQPEGFQQAVLPFGSIASVTPFLTWAMGTWQIGSGLLKSTWTSYFDDFLSLTPGCIDKHTGLCISTFLHLFGCRLSEYKLALYDQCCKVLGVELALCKSPTGAFEVRNTESRRLELIASLESVLEKGFLPRHEG